MDTAPRFGTLAEAQKSGAPVLLIAQADSADDPLRQLQIDADPGLTQVPRSAAVWAARTPDNARTVLIVSAENAQAVESLMRPLPHYGGQSYVLFQGRKAVHKGIWPVARGPLYRGLQAQ